MSLKRTEKGRSALLQGDACITVIERRILILSDGRRPRAQVFAMLGDDVGAALQRLLYDGYVCEINAARKTVQPVLSIVAANAAPPPVKREVPAAAAPARRSLVVAKVYLLDILELQRDAESAALRAAIRSSANEDDLIRLLLQALAHLQTVATASMAQRVRERLAEVLPEAYLPQLLSWRGRITSPVLVAVA